MVTDPKQIDAQLAQLYGQLYQHQARKGHHQARIDNKRLAQARCHASSSRYKQLETEIAGLQQLTLKASDQMAAVRDQMEPLQCQYQRKPWARYYLVTNTNGHVHSSTHCSTCYPSTQYQWLTRHSGREVADMVAHFGELMCTVCFPSAPTFKGYGDGTSALARMTSKEQADRAQAKLARQAQKAAKAITQPDGQPLRENCGRGCVIKTERSARIALTDAITWALNPNSTEQGRDRNRDEADYLCRAIAAKTGEKYEQVMDTHIAKAKAKLRQWQRQAAAHKQALEEMK